MTGITSTGTATSLMQQLLLQMSGTNTASSSPLGQAGSSSSASSLFNLQDADTEGDTTAATTGNIGSAFRMLSTQAQASLLNAQEQCGSQTASGTSTSTTAADTSAADNTNNLLQQLSSYQHAHGRHHHGGADPAQTADSSQGGSSSSTPTDFASLLQQYASEGSGSATASSAQDQLLSVVA